MAKQAYRVKYKCTVQPDEDEADYCSGWAYGDTPKDAEAEVKRDNWDFDYAVLTEPIEDPMK